MKINRWYRSTYATDPGDVPAHLKDLDLDVSAKVDCTSLFYGDNIVGGGFAVRHHGAQETVQEGNIALAHVKLAKTVRMVHVVAVHVRNGQLHGQAGQ